MGIDDITVESGFEEEVRFSIVGHHYQKFFLLEDNQLKEVLNS